MLKSILKIIRNLSFINDNEQIILKCNKLIEIKLPLFIICIDYECTLCSLEILTIISKHLLLKDFPYSKFFFSSLHQALYASEKAMRDLVMECFWKLSLSSGNEEYLEDMPDDFIATLVQCLISYNPETRDRLKYYSPSLTNYLLLKVRIAKCDYCIKRLIELAANTGDIRIEENSSC